MMKLDKQTIIETLHMKPHPEGGYYYESYRSEDMIDNNHLYTSIYFLLESGNISHFHRIPSDEMWYYHGGDSLTIHMIHPDGTYAHQKLGLDVASGEAPQFLVPKNTIFASTVEDEDEWALVGCMVAPGFSFDTFELFTQDELRAIYPQHESIIKQYAYESIEN